MKYGIFNKTTNKLALIDDDNMVSEDKSMLDEFVDELNNGPVFFMYRIEGQFYEVREVRK